MLCLQSSLLLSSTVNEPPPPGFPVGLLLREMPVSRAFLHISFRVPSYGALPPGSPCRVPVERDALLPEPSSICLSKSTVKRNPHPGYPTGPLWWDLPVSRVFFYISLGAPDKQGLLIKQNLTLLSSPR
jgi:hypothetical protein